MASIYGTLLSSQGSCAAERVSDGDRSQGNPLTLFERLSQVKLAACDLRHNTAESGLGNLLYMYFFRSPRGSVLPVVTTVSGAF